MPVRGRGVEEGSHAQRKRLKGPTVDDLRHHAVQQFRAELGRSLPVQWTRYRLLVVLQTFFIPSFVYHHIRASFPVRLHPTAEPKSHDSDAKFRSINAELIRNEFDGSTLEEQRLDVERLIECLCQWFPTAGKPEFIQEPERITLWMSNLVQTEQGKIQKRRATTIKRAPIRARLQRQRRVDLTAEHRCDVINKLEIGDTFQHGEAMVEVIGVPLQESAGSVFTRVRIYGPTPIDCDMSSRSTPLIQVPSLDWYCSCVEQAKITHSSRSTAITPASDCPLVQRDLRTQTIQEEILPFLKHQLGDPWTIVQQYIEDKQESQLETMVVQL
jgi:hypothetical protein